MGRLHTTAHTADTSDVSQTVPGWRALLEQIERKDERIDELECEVQRLRDELERLQIAPPDCDASSRKESSSKAAELVDALRQTDGNGG